MKPVADKVIFCTLRLESPPLDKLAQKLKADGRAHALFDLWRNLVNQPNALTFVLKPPRDTKAAFHLCIECGQAFSGAELVFRHFRQQHAGKAVKSVQKTVEPPKGNFQFVARCGLCRALLCPPNYHEFSARLVTHHRERHDQVPFDEFRAKVTNSNSPDDVEAWRKALSVMEELHCAFCDEFVTDERALLDHVRQAHAGNVEKTEAELAIPAMRVRHLECRDIRRACNQVWDKEKKEPGHFLALLRQALSQRGLQIFRDILGHQYACRCYPRSPSERDQLTPRQQEILALASAPARRGHKPNRHTLRDHFAAQAVGELDVKTDVDALVKAGLLVELDNGQLDALGPGSHIAT
ncbi:MAG: hypothetical protein HZA88_01040 [Verrucomicrobia bacterium]|nr:hypothetical protein [Verrucomicrobiota bacterium]